MFLALVCALVTLVSYGVGTVLQAVGARRTSTSEHLDVMLFARLARQLPYMAGLALDAVGFAASLVALHTLPLFVVQAAVAGSIGVTALTCVFVLHIPLHRRDVVALVVLMFGLVLLGASARSEAVASLSSLGAWLLLAGVGVVLIGAVVAARLRDPQGAIGLAACAGLGFTGTAIAARALHVPSPLWHLLYEPIAIALVLYGAAAMLMFASALQRGAATATAAVMLSVETIVPAIVGLVALGDRTRSHFEVVALVGFGLTLWASLALARYTEPSSIVEHEPV